ncbi:hypothetical protein [Streptomyces qinglanensis]|uniref:hypothetical protein n=1 Tax=Streptomyces qinglanensis TaxID=943816 RepID=UPI003D737AB4
MPVSTHRAGASLALTAVCLLAAGRATGDAPDSRSDAEPTASPARRDRAGPGGPADALGSGSDRQGEQADR